MTMNNSRFNIPRSLPLPITHAEQRLNQLQEDLVSTARMWAVDEVSAAMAHRLNEPLTALLLYLHRLKDERQHSVGETAAPDTMRELVERAILETRRVCDITEQLGNILKRPVAARSVVARGPEAIDLWTWSSDAKSSGHASAGPPRFGQRLTPREREVLALITGGASNKAGGHQLGISKRTFEGHRAHIMEKLGAKNAADLGRLAMRHADK
jgi:DNA-binding CsgD family transcriptional regulator